MPHKLLTADVPMSSNPLVNIHEYSMKIPSASYSEKLDKEIPEKSGLDRVDTDSQYHVRSKTIESDAGRNTVGDEFGTTRFVRREPVITTGADVSNYAVDVRDDGDEALTFRSITIGTIVAGLGAALAEVSSCFTLADPIGKVYCGQIYIYKPINVTISSIFLLLFVYTIGKAWARFLPTGDTFENNPRWAWLASTARFINPGPFGLKEVCLIFLETCLRALTIHSNFSACGRNITMHHSR